MFAGCDRDDDVTPIDPAYQLFPAGFFSLGYQEQYILSGVATNSGSTFQGTHIELNEGNTMFDNQTAIRVRVQNEWTDENSIPFENGAFSFYSTESSNRKLLGTEDLFTQDVFILANPEVIPETAEIGDSGVIGIDTNASNETITQTWSLDTAPSGRAYLIFATEVRDATGAVTFIGNTTYEIEQNGNRVSMTILFDVKALDDPVNWTGTKI